MERVNGLEWKRARVCVRRSISFQFHPRSDKSHWLTTGLRYEAVEAIFLAIFIRQFD